MGQLNEKGLVLDFGCGKNHLKKMLKNKQVIGYDIVKEYTDIEDYTILKPSKIVCNSVLEYLTSTELRTTITNFKKMNDKAILIVSLPTKNLLSKFLMFILKRPSHSKHKLNLDEVNKIITEQYILVKSKTVMTMAKIRKYQVIGRNIPKQQTF